MAVEISNYKHSITKRDSFKHYRGYTGGSINIHSSDLAFQLLADNVIQTVKPKHLTRDSHVSQAELLHASNTKKKYMNRLKTSHLTEYRRYLAKDLIRKCQSTLGAIPEIFETYIKDEKDLGQDISKYVSQLDLIKQRKKEILHKKWMNQVYEPLRHEIMTEMSSENFNQFNHRKKQLYKQYLEFNNMNRHISLDLDTVEEYYSMALYGYRPSSMHANVKRLSDPLQRETRSQSDENRTVLRCLTGSTFTDHDLDQIMLPPVPLIPHKRKTMPSKHQLYFVIPTTHKDNTSQLNSFYKREEKRMALRKDSCTKLSNDKPGVSRNEMLDENMTTTTNQDSAGPRVRNCSQYL